MKIRNSLAHFKISDNIIVLGSSYAGCNGNVNCIIQPSVFNYLHHMSAKRTFTKNILCQIEFKTS